MKANRWSVEFETLPFSFRYNGQHSESLLPAWRRQREGQGLEQWLDPQSGLCVRARIRRFEDFPALDWLLELENCGGADTPIVENLLPLDLILPLAESEVLRLHYCRGSSARIDDFVPIMDELNPFFDDPIHLKAILGRSSCPVLPYFHLERAADGMTIAVGWSGQWAVSLARLRSSEPGSEQSADGARFTAGMETTRFRLRPGERVRTPRILLLCWEGGSLLTAVNRFRQLMFEHYLPRIHGKLPKLPRAFSVFDVGDPVNEELEMTAQRRAAPLGFDTHWIDASWFGRSDHPWWEDVGTWTVDGENYPHGLRPISDGAHEKGMRFLLWIDPEHARADSQIAREHPSFILRRSDRDRDNLLVDLGNPEARAYITDLVSRLIAENRVDIYRQDFNIHPLPYWREADAPDRVGIAEMLHIDGLYEFWDELLRRHPGLLIDNCASGGTRIDLETCSRSVPLWCTDFQVSIFYAFGLDALHISAQCLSGGLAPWVPLFSTGVPTFAPYGFRSLVGPGRVCFLHIDRGSGNDRRRCGNGTALAKRDWAEVWGFGTSVADDAFPADLARQALAEAESLEPYFQGDFYALLPVTTSPAHWCAYQYHRTDMAAGFAVFFRRPQSLFSQMEAGLHGLDAAAEYMVSLSPGYREQPRRRMSGSELEALTVEIPDRPGSVLLRYARA